MKYFYSHLIQMESVIIELDKLDLNTDQKKHLADLVDSSLHHTVLDAVLSELTPSDKKVFINHLKEENHGRIWEFLNGKVNNIEGKIKKAADDLKLQLHKDLKEAGKIK